MNNSLKNCHPFKDFCDLLKTDPAIMEYCLLHPSYRQSVIRKKSGGLRTIHIPNPQLRILQNKLLPVLNNLYRQKVPDCVHGFVETGAHCVPRNIISNAGAHIGKKHLLNIDLKDFFHSISARMIKDALIAFPYKKISEEVSSIIALLVTKDWFLPMGSPTSPVISNIVFYKLDFKLMSFAKTNNLCYSRYADDLTFSGDYFITTALKDEICQILLAEGFKVNPKKIRFQSEHMAQVVTGIKVNEKLNVDRKYIRNLRAILHSWETTGINDTSERYLGSKFVVDPNLSFIRSVEAKIRFVEHVRHVQDPVSIGLRSKFVKLYTSFKAEL
jgi:RNA-directed DNA polymerase